MFSMARSRTSASSSRTPRPRRRSCSAAPDAAQADVEQVTQGRETAEAWAEELRAQLDELQVQFAARDEVIDDAEAIRQAEAERQAKGRWARLRAAWQGG